MLPDGDSQNDTSQTPLTNQSEFDNNLTTHKGRRMDTISLTKKIGILNMILIEDKYKGSKLWSRIEYQIHERYPRSTILKTIVKVFNNPEARELLQTSI